MSRQGDALPAFFLPPIIDASIQQGRGNLSPGDSAPPPSVEGLGDSDLARSRRGIGFGGSGIVVYRGHSREQGKWQEETTHFDEEPDGRE